MDGHLPWSAALGAGFLFCAGAAALAGGEARASRGALRFLRDGVVVKETDLESLKRACKVTRIDVDDPYYKRKKSFLAFALQDVLSFGFGQPRAELGREDFFFEALDGYVKPTPGEKLQAEGGYLAFADAELTRGVEPRWQPIDRRGLDPGPYYLVWTRPEQSEANGYPWPYELASIEIVRFEKKYPFTLPESAAPNTAAWRGFRTFRTECIACHSVNGQGGKIGPDLNVPQSIVEYRPVEQVKAYIRNPETFRYGSMPAHLHFSAAELDDLVAYFTAMKDLKHDPRSAR